jgi:hypothetical protein
MSRLSPAEIAEVAHQAGFRGHDLQVAVAVALAESGGRPGVNAAGAEDSRGLWQINSVHFGGLDESRLDEPLYNARAAHQVWEESRSFRPDPWDAWSTYGNGLHRQYMDDARRGVQHWRQSQAGDGGGHGHEHGRGHEQGQGNGHGHEHGRGHGHGRGRGHGDGGIAPWQLPRRPLAGHCGRRVRVDGAMMQGLASRLTGLLATVDAVYHRCRRERADLRVPDLADSAAGRKLVRKLDEALDDWDGMRRLPYLMTRDIGFVVEAWRRFEDADRGEARAAIGALIASLRKDHHGRSGARVAALLRAVYGPDGGRRVRGYLPTSPHRGSHRHAGHGPRGHGGHGGSGRHDSRRVGLRRLANIAHDRFNLTIREFQPWDRVDPVHSPTSWHYQNRAFDASGSTGDMRRFADWVSDHHGNRLKELFWNGPGARNIKNGEHVGRWFVPGHTDHVHVAM